jgi:hypothetical protein
MDIDSPPSNSYDDLPLTPAQQAGHTHLNLPHFSASYPLPFRVLTLVGLEILLWAINLHVLTSLGVDAGRALDLTEDDEGGLLDGEETSEPQILFDGDSLTGDSEPSPSRIIRLDSPSPTTTHIRRQSHSYSHPYRQKRTRKDLHGPIYLSFFVYSGWVLLGWSGFKYVSEMGGGMDGARWVLVVIAAGIAMGLGWRKGFIARAERMGLLRYVRTPEPSALPPSTLSDNPLSPSIQLVQTNPIPSNTTCPFLRRRDPSRHNNLVRKGLGRLGHLRISNI